MKNSALLSVVLMSCLLTLTSCDNSSSSKPAQQIVSNLSQDQVEKFRGDWTEESYSTYFQNNKKERDETEISEGQIFSIDDKGELSITLASSKYSYDNEIEFPAQIHTIKYGVLIQDEKNKITVKMNEEYKKDLMKKYNITEDEAKKSLDITMVLRINEEGRLVSSQPGVEETSMSSIVFKRMTADEKQDSLKRTQARIDLIKSKLDDTSSLLLGKSFELIEEEAVYMDETGKVQNTFKKLAKDILEEETSGEGVTKQTLPNAKTVKFIETGKVLINGKVGATAQYQLNGNETQLSLSINIDSDGGGYFKTASGTLSVNEDSLVLVRKYQYKNEKAETILVIDTHKYKTVK